MPYAKKVPKTPDSKLFKSGAEGLLPLNMFGQYDPPPKDSNLLHQSKVNCLKGLLTPG
jgi:hypothetical protein